MKHSTAIAARVHVLWAASFRPEPVLMQAGDLGLTCSAIHKTNDEPLRNNLPVKSVETMGSAHLVFVVTDCRTATWSDLARAVGAEAGSNPPIHLLLTDGPAQAQAACIGISRLAALLNTECPIGIDVEDVRMALTSSGNTRIAAAKAIGFTRTQDAVNLVLRELRLATPASSVLNGLLVIFAGASDSLTLKEAGMAIKQIQPDLAPGMRFAYALLHDDSLEDELQVTVFAAHNSGLR